MAAVDMNRLSEGVNLSPKDTADIWAKGITSSAVMQLTPRIDMPGTGISIQSITGDPVAEWVAETEEKPVGKTSFATKTMTPYKMAVIELFSEEFVRDAGRLYTAVRSRLPKTLGTLLDKTVLYGTPPGTGFDVLSDAPEIALGTGAQLESDLLAINSAIAAGGNRLSGWGLSPQAEARLIGARGGDGQLIFSQTFRDEISVGTILGRPAYISDALYHPAVEADAEAEPPVAAADAVIGLAGDWSQARLGIVSNIRLKATSEATVTLGDGTQVNLWQRNMIGLLVEAEMGFIVNDKTAFVRLTQATEPPAQGE